MEDELAIILPGVIVMLIVIGLSVNGIVGKVLRHKREMYELERNGRPDKGRLQADRTDLIEERLEVLERIATDRRNNLALEIEELRSNEALEAPSQTERNT